MTEKPITVLTDKKNIDTVKNICEKIKESLPGIEFSPYKFGQIGEQMIITFKVADKYHQRMIERLIFNNVKVLTNEKKVLEIVESVRNRMSRGDDSNFREQDWTDIKEQAQKKSSVNLEQEIRNGDYRKVIAISKDIKLAPEVIEKAKNTVGLAVSNAIEKERQKAESTRTGKEEAMDNLLGIAADVQLKNMGIDKVLKQAGLYAINIAAANIKMQDELINIANNSRLPNYINVHATIRLARIISNPEELREGLVKELIADAVRKLNVRFLLIAFDSVSNEINADEEELFNFIINLVTETRKIAGE